MADGGGCNIQESKMAMKQAICEGCGKDMKHQVPDDAEGILCFSCNENELKKARPNVTGKKPK
jgi:hypothetical protein